mmetsp:Transcript_13794/g.21841  ORF Transcript_13794/g.21841 Transcript_13794/m.21841 type:complete len:271 (+) Transcript_13794:266-1078(+)
MPMAVKRVLGHMNTQQFFSTTICARMPRSLLGVCILWLKCRTLLLVKHPYIETNIHTDIHIYMYTYVHVYISERLGLGELLLTGTLHAHNCASVSSHLFVSSKNVSAVKCYMRFGYDRGTCPSGKAAHDFVMEMRNCKEGVMRSVERLSQQLLMGTIGACRCRKPADWKMKDKKRATGVSPTECIDSRSSSATSSTSSVETVSRVSSRSTFRSSPPPNAMKPRACKAEHCEEADESSSTRRSVRQASDRDSFELVTFTSKEATLSDCGQD